MADEIEQDQPAPKKPYKPNKMVCKVRRRHFKLKAPVIEIRILDIGCIELLPHTFKTNTFGWYYHGKKKSTLDGIEMDLQINFCITVIGSRDAKP